MSKCVKIVHFGELQLIGGNNKDINYINSMNSMNSMNNVNNNGNNIKNNNHNILQINNNQ